MHQLLDMQDYMLTDMLINKFNRQTNNFVEHTITSHNLTTHTKTHLTNPDKLEKPHKKQTITSSKVAEKNTPEQFSPPEKDKLFWCFYILLNGFDEYELSKKSSFKCEKETKITSVEKLSSIKDILKELKLKRTEIQDELVNQNIIGIKGLYALCLINKVNLLYVKDRVYYEFNCGEVDEPFKVIINDTNNTYISYNPPDETKLTFYRENYWKVDNIQKPLTAFSGYSLGELQDICRRLDIPLLNGTKKKTKKELYENILVKL